MTEQEAIKHIDSMCCSCSYWNDGKCHEDGKCFESMQMAIKALEETQEYRAIGTVEEFKALKEADMRGANTAVDEFANYLHRIAKENNGLRLSSETRSWTHPCIFDYLEEFKNDQICKEET